MAKRRGWKPLEERGGMGSLVFRKVNQPPAVVAEGRFPRGGELRIFGKDLHEGGDAGASRRAWKLARAQVHEEPGRVLVHADPVERAEAVVSLPALHADLGLQELVVRELPAVVLAGAEEATGPDRRSRSGPLAG